MVNPKAGRVDPSGFHGLHELGLCVHFPLDRIERLAAVLQQRSWV